LSGQEPRTASEERVLQQPDSLEGQILLLMQAGKKIEAIKLYRQETGNGLKDAKDAVEALAAGQPIARRSGESVETNGVDPNSLEGQVLSLMRDQKKIWAIKVYREKTGVGLKQAKDAVEALAAKHGISTQTGCAGMVLLLVAISTILVVGLWGLPG
jgi:ribosomal protein L7/L12